MADNKVGCLPVVAPAESGDTGDTAGTLAGIVTESDLFGAFVRALGVLEPGSRLAVHLVDPANDLLALALTLREQAAPVLSLTSEPLPAATGAEPTPGHPRLRLTVRLGTIDPRPLVAALRRRGLTVEYPAGWPERPDRGTARFAEHVATAPASEAPAEGAPEGAARTTPPGTGGAGP
jgi:hypothetical protein